MQSNAPTRRVRLLPSPSQEGSGARQRAGAWVLGVLPLALLCVACQPQSPAHVDAVVASVASSSPAAASHSGPIRPLPRDGVSLDPARVALGRTLFHDPGLSRDGTISCASCHDLARGGADGRVTSVGVGGAVGEVNAPTVLNSGFNFAQFWDGRAGSLEEQVDGPLLSPTEMASSWESAIAHIRATPNLESRFMAAYVDGVSPRNVRDAIATFERSLVTPDAPMDRYLRGDLSALTPEQLAGYRLFTDIGCSSCHQGINVGGNMFQTFGKMKDYFADHPHARRRADQGRFNITGLERDRHKFKVPSLRNIELTAPYLHDGSAAALQDAVKIMATYQLGQDLTSTEIQQIVSFLHALTGEQPK